jgi:hypothetical protein
MVRGVCAKSKKGGAIGSPYLLRETSFNLLRAISVISLGRLVAQGQRVLFAGEANFGQRPATITISLHYGCVARR